MKYRYNYTLLVYYNKIRLFMQERAAQSLLQKKKGGTPIHIFIIRARRAQTGKNKQFQRI